MPLQSRLNSPILSVFGRLRPGISLGRATAEIGTINRQYATDHPANLDAKQQHAEPVTLLRDELVKKVRSNLWMLFGSVGFVLLIACSNVASLLLARAASRSREIAVRAALGASRNRIVRQMMTESMLLALIGGVLGAVLAAWAVVGIRRLPGLELPRVDEIHLDGSVLTFVLVLSAATSLVFGLLPSFRSAQADLAGIIKVGPSSHLRLRTRFTLLQTPRGLLVVGQIALSIILLIGAALLLESLARLSRVDPGFRVADLLTFEITLPEGKYNTTARSSAFFDRLVQQVESIPGVEGAAVTLTLPMTGWAGMPVQLIGQPILKLNQRPIAVLQSVTPGYFRTMQIPIKQGRDFSAADGFNAPAVVIISQCLAKHFWPADPYGKESLGHYIWTGASQEPLRIIGVAGDIRQDSLADNPELGFYRPRAQMPPLSAMFAVHTRGNPTSFVKAIRSQVSTIDPDQSIRTVRTMEEVVETSEGQRRSIMILLELFAGAGLLLCIVGIYGAISYWVAQRTKELGIRRALGAQERDLIASVLGQGIGLILPGVTLGVAGALILTRVLNGLVYGISTTDPFTFTAIAALLAFVALGACYIPARRAATIQPSTALRSE